MVTRASKPATCGQDVRTTNQARCLSYSVQIWLREWKRVLDQFDPRFRVFSDDNFNYVETEKYIRVLQHPEPGERAA